MRFDLEAAIAEFNARQRAEPVPFAAANVERIMRAIFAERANSRSIRA